MYICSIQNITMRAKQGSVRGGGRDSSVLKAFFALITAAVNILGRLPVSYEINYIFY